MSLLACSDLSNVVMIPSLIDYIGSNVKQNLGHDTTDMNANYYRNSLLMEIFPMLPELYCKCYSSDQAVKSPA